MYLAVFYNIVTSHSRKRKIRSRLLLLDNRITHKHLLQAFNEKAQVFLSYISFLFGKTRHRCQLFHFKGNEFGKFSHSESMRSNATRAQRAVSSSTLTWLMTWPSTKPSNTQA